MTNRTPSAKAGGAMGANGGGGGTRSGVSAKVDAARASEANATATRARILPQGAAHATTFTKANIEALPRGNQTSFDQVLLQLPGVTQDSSGSGDSNIRNEHANAQYRINGIFLPGGVSGFSQALDSVFIRSVTLLDGALPAQYGLRTAGIIDIETRTGAENLGGSISTYGGSGHPSGPGRAPSDAHRSLRMVERLDQDRHGKIELGPTRSRRATLGAGACGGSMAHR